MTLCMGRKSTKLSASYFDNGIQTKIPTKPLSPAEQRGRCGSGVRRLANNMVNMGACGFE